LKRKKAFTLIDRVTWRSAAELTWSRTRIHDACSARYSTSLVLPPWGLRFRCRKKRGGRWVATTVKCRTSVKGLECLDLGLDKLEESVQVEPCLCRRRPSCPFKVHGTRKFSSENGSQKMYMNMSN
jgi:hypothetical protein